MMHRHLALRVLVAGAIALLGIAGITANPAGASIGASTTTVSAMANSSIALGQSNTDTATVTGNSTDGVPTGEVDFYICGPTPKPTPCTSEQYSVSSESGPGSGDSFKVGSLSFTPTATGYWCFAADYSGDATYGPSSDTSVNECFQVTNPPFVCTSSMFFLSQHVPTALYTGTETSNIASFNQLGPTATQTYNALGFDPNNNYLYAIAGGSDDLLRIDGTGTVTSLGPITGYPTIATNVGAFDGSGNYWVTTTNQTTAYEIDVTSSPPSVMTTVSLNAQFPADDWTWAGPAATGYFWGLSGKMIYRVDISSGVVSAFTAPAGLLATSSTTFGAAWTYGNGNLGFSNNQSGVINEISVTNPGGSPPTFGVVASYTSTQVAGKNNDGAACVGEPTDLSIVKTGPTSVAPGGTITWQMTVTNNGPGNSSGFAVSDVLPPGVTGVTLPAGCVLTGHTVTCSEGSLADGSSLTITITGKAPKTEGTCLTNTATVTGNEADPVTGNNSSSVTTCTSTPDYGTLKVCKVAGLGVAVGTPVTFNYTTKSGGGTVTVPAGPAPGGYCVVVGTVAPGAYTITEVIPSGNTVTSITAVPSGGKAILGKGSFTGKLTARTVTEVTYTDQDVPQGDETGYLEICKQVQQSPVPPPDYFVFTVNEPGGLTQTVDVPPNACSPATEVISGSETVTETPVSPYVMSGCSAIPAASLVSCDPGDNTATVTVAPGAVSAESILSITNDAEG